MPIKDWKKEIWTIPNILSLLRLIMIPIYAHIFLNATQPKDYALAAAILALSCLTDMLDGRIARKYNMISTLGKILDPIADKATQLTMILCLSYMHPQLWVLMGLFILKEGFQAIAGIVHLSRGKMLDGALMAGKVSTTVLFVSLILMVLYPGMSSELASIITAICCVFLMIAFIQYIRAYYGKNKKVYSVPRS